MKILLYTLSVYLFISHCKTELITFYIEQGLVGRGNFTYYKINDYGEIHLVLDTLVGDADMYISQTIEAPTFEPEMYDLHSATCGQDCIVVPSSFKRPIFVGIYGHSSHEISTFIIRARQDSDIEVTEPKSHDNKKTEKTGGKLVVDGMVFNLPVVVRKAGIWSLLEILEILVL